MKAYEIHEYTGPGGLRLVERPQPRPGPFEALVRVRFAALNNRDLVVLKGLHGARRDPCLVPLGDGAGDVVEVGPGTTRVRPGDRVCGAFYQRWLTGPPTAENLASSLGGDIDGMLAEYVVLAEDGLVRLPDGLDLAHAATLPCAAVTAWSALRTIQVLPAGASVLILGTSGVALFALQFARILGLRTIVATSTAQKQAKVRDLGADATLNYHDIGDWHVEVLRLTSGRGVDHVVDLGGAHTLAKSLQAVRLGGSVAVIGFLAGAGSVDPRLLVARQVRAQGLGVGPRESLVEVVRAVETNAIAPVIDRLFAFADAIDAYHYFAGKGHFGKVVIAVT